MIRLWLDDEDARYPSSKFSPLADSTADRYVRLDAATLPAGEQAGSTVAWYWVRTVEQLLELVRLAGLEAVDRISFDSDLGIGFTEGREALDRLEEVVALDSSVVRVPDMWPHTRNPESGRVMAGVIGRIYLLVESRGGTCGDPDDWELGHLRRQCVRVAEGWGGDMPLG